MTFRDLKLRTKQRIGFGLILIIMAGANVYAVQKMATLKEALDEVTTNWLPRAIATNDLRANASALWNVQMQSLLTTDTVRRQEHQQTLIALLDSIEANRDTYELLRAESEAEGLYSEEERRLYDAFDEKWESYLDLSFTLIDLSENNQRQAALDLLLNQAEAVYTDFSSDLQRLVSIKIEDASTAAINAEATFTNTRTVAQILLVVTIVLSTLIASLLVRYITVPIGQLVEAAGKVAKGNLDVQLAVNSNDEVGRLSRSFNKMTLSLNRSQKQLIQAEKMASLGQLTAGIAHEIKNPLNFVNNFSEMNLELVQELNDELTEAGDQPAALLLEEIRDLIEDISENSKRISEHGQRADNIVKSMLEHSRSTPGHRQKTDINNLVSEYINLASHSLRTRYPELHPSIERKLAENLPQITVIPQDIGRVILNLLNNAFYALHERSEQEPPSYRPTVSIQTKQLDKAIEITIQDNGTGIGKEIREKIFEPFFTTKPTGEGTGLGLSLSYEIVVNGHGGQMNVKSPPTQGALFVISLPLQ